MMDQNLQLDIQFDASACIISARHINALSMVCKHACMCSVASLLVLPLDIKHIARVKWLNDFMFANTTSLHMAAQLNWLSKECYTVAMVDTDRAEDASVII